MPKSSRKSFFGGFLDTPILSANAVMPPIPPAAATVGMPPPMGGKRNTRKASRKDRKDRKDRKASRKNRK